MTPRLPADRTLVGDWRLSGGGEAPCRVRLRLEPAGARSLRFAPGPRPSALAAAASWRVAADGMAFTDAAGHTLVFLSRLGPDLYAGEGGRPSAMQMRRAD